MPQGTGAGEEPPARPQPASCAPLGITASEVHHRPQTHSSRGLLGEGCFPSFQASPGGRQVTTDWEPLSQHSVPE